MATGAALGCRRWSLRLDRFMLKDRFSASAHDASPWARLVRDGGSAARAQHDFGWPQLRTAR
jgi:hypothetical protein